MRIAALISLENLLSWRSSAALEFFFSVIELSNVPATFVPKLPRSEKSDPVARVENFTYPCRRNARLRRVGTGGRLLIYRKIYNIFRAHNKRLIENIMADVVFKKKYICICGAFVDY